MARPAVTEAGFPPTRPPGDDWRGCAVFGRRRNAGDRDLAKETAADLAAEAGDEAAGEVSPASGPWDVAEPYTELQRVDLGSLQVPVMAGMDIQLVFAEEHGAWVTVRHELSELQLQAFAAPKRDSLWDDVRTEIVAEIAGAGGMSLASSSCRRSPRPSATRCGTKCAPRSPRR